MSLPGSVSINIKTVIDENNQNVFRYNLFDLQDASGNSYVDVEESYWATYKTTVTFNPNGDADYMKVGPQNYDEDSYDFPTAAYTLINGTKYTVSVLVKNEDGTPFAETHVQTTLQTLPEQPFDAFTVEINSAGINVLMLSEYLTNQAKIGYTPITNITYTVYPQVLGGVIGTGHFYQDFTDPLSLPFTVEIDRLYELSLHTTNLVGDSASFEIHNIKFVSGTSPVLLDYQQTDLQTFNVALGTVPVPTDSDNYTFEKYEYKIADGDWTSLPSDSTITNSSATGAVNTFVLALRAKFTANDSTVAAPIASVYSYSNNNIITLIGAVAAPVLSIIQNGSSAIAKVADSNDKAVYETNTAITVTDLFSFNDYDAEAADIVPDNFNSVDIDIEAGEARTCSAMTSVSHNGFVLLSVVVAIHYLGYDQLDAPTLSVAYADNNTHRIHWIGVTDATNYTLTRGETVTEVDSTTLSATYTNDGETFDSYVSASRTVTTPSPFADYINTSPDSNVVTFTALEDPIGSTTMTTLTPTANGQLKFSFTPVNTIYKYKFTLTAAGSTTPITYDSTDSNVSVTPTTQSSIVTNTVTISDLLDTQLYEVKLLVCNADNCKVHATKTMATRAVSATGGSIGVQDNGDVEVTWTQPNVLDSPQTQTVTYNGTTSTDGIVGDGEGNYSTTIPLSDLSEGGDYEIDILTTSGGVTTGLVNKLSVTPFVKPTTDATIDLIEGSLFSAGFRIMKYTMSCGSSDTITSATFNGASMTLIDDVWQIGISSDTLTTGDIEISVTSNFDTSATNPLLTTLSNVAVCGPSTPIVSAISTNANIVNNQIYFNFDDVAPSFNLVGTYEYVATIENALGGFTKDWTNALTLPESNGLTATLTTGANYQITVRVTYGADEGVGNIISSVGKDSAIAKATAVTGTPDTLSVELVNGELVLTITNAPSTSNRSTYWMDDEPLVSNVTGLTYTYSADINSHTFSSTSYNSGAPDTKTPRATVTYTKPSEPSEPEITEASLTRIDNTSLKCQVDDNTYSDVSGNVVSYSFALYKQTTSASTHVRTVSNHSSNYYTFTSLERDAVYLVQCIMTWTTGSGTDAVSVDSNEFTTNKMSTSVAPSGVSVVATASNSQIVSTINVSTVVGFTVSSIVSYKLTSASDTTYNPINGVTLGNNTTYTQTGLSNGKTYTIKVVSTYTSKTDSSYIVTKSDTTNAMPLSGPTITNVELVNNTIVATYISYSIVNEVGLFFTEVSRSDNLLYTSISQTAVRTAVPNTTNVYKLTVIVDNASLATFKNGDEILVLISETNGSAYKTVAISGITIA
jgi:hypothetical protein